MTASSKPVKSRPTIDFLMPMHWPDSKVASCELGFTPLGPEVRVMRDRTVLYSRIFAAGHEALAWAEEERQDLLRAGWVDQDCGAGNSDTVLPR